MEEISGSSSSQEAAPGQKAGEVQGPRAEEKLQTATSAQQPKVPATGERTPGSILGLIWPFALLFLLMYLLMIRPQRKRDKERLGMLDRIKRGDTIQTIGGIRGEIMSVGGSEVVLRIDEKKDIRIRLSRSAVQTVVEAGAEEKEKQEKTRETKDKNTQ